jgi:hypothetical protein
MHLIVKSINKYQDYRLMRAVATKRTVNIERLWGQCIADKWGIYCKDFVMKFTFNYVYIKKN